MKSHEPCNAYRTVKPGVICQTCKKSVNELHLRNDDDAKCLGCFEQECLDRLMMEQLKRGQIDEPEEKDQGLEIMADVYKYYCPFDCEITSWEKEKHD